MTDYINIVLNEHNSFGENRAVDLDSSEKCKKWEEICFGNEGDVS